MIPGMGGMPSLQMSNSASSGAYGGTQGGTSGALKEGDWNVTTGTGNTGMSKKTLMYVAIAGVAFWFLKNKKTAA